ncbi:MAG: hypothetical protein ABGY95_12650 [Rubritalea sp.]|uniref:hypothetical protein n=1 Tax=Rubritalea sp. TaxID=2109375 RepID=UPI003241C67F
MNPFDTFSLSPILALDLDMLSKVYQNLAAQNHPDKSGDKSQFEKINLDYAILRSPSNRLKAYMDYAAIEYDARGAVSNDLMDLFMRVGSLIQEADAFIRKKSAATSILAKALLEAESMELQDKLSALISQIESNQSKITESFASPIDNSDLPQIARNLSFLEKWQAQLQQRYGSLF